MADCFGNHDTMQCPKFLVLCGEVNRNNNKPTTTASVPTTTNYSSTQSTGLRPSSAEQRRSPGGRGGQGARAPYGRGSGTRGNYSASSSRMGNNSYNKPPHTSRPTTHRINGQQVRVTSAPSSNRSNSDSGSISKSRRRNRNPH